MPFLALVEHTNFIGPENYGGNHILYISNYLRQDHEYFGMDETELWAIFEPALKRVNPAFSSDWVNAALAVQGAVRAADHRDRVQHSTGPITARRSMACTWRR